MSNLQSILVLLGAWGVLIVLIILFFKGANILDKED